MTRVVKYVGAPLGGQELDAADWSEAEIRGGTYEIVDGWADRADYSPDEDGDPLIWRYRGPVSD